MVTSLVNFRSEGTIDMQSKTTQFRESRKRGDEEGPSLDAHIQNLSRGLTVAGCTDKPTGRKPNRS